MTRKAETRRCSRCREAKPLAAFPRNRGRPDGVSLWCRLCKREGERQRRASPATRAARGLPTPQGHGAPVSSGSTPAFQAPVRPRGHAPGSRGGRPSKLTPEAINALCEQLARGHTRRASCAKVGLGESTLRAWLDDARRDDASPLHQELVRCVELAEGQGEYALVEIVRTAATIDVNQAKWLLERRHSQDWARKEESVTLHTDEKPPDIKTLRNAIAKRIEAMIAARPAPGAPPDDDDDQDGEQDQDQVGG